MHYFKFLCKAYQVHLHKLGSSHLSTVAAHIFAGDLPELPFKRASTLHSFHPFPISCQESVSLSHLLGKFLLHCFKPKQTVTLTEATDRISNLCQHLRLSWFSKLSFVKHIVQYSSVFLQYRAESTRAVFLLLIEDQHILVLNEY